MRVRVRVRVRVAQPKKGIPFSTDELGGIYGTFFFKKQLKNAKQFHKIKKAHRPWALSCGLW